MKIAGKLIGAACLLCCAVVWAQAPDAEGKLRTWTDATGTHRVQARLRSVAADKVVLELASGATVEVPLDKLSPDDRRFVIRNNPARRQALEAAAVQPAPTTPVAAAAGQWPTWRGPNRDGLSAETGLLSSWPADGPPQLWAARGLGKGYSSVSISGGRVFTMGFRDGQELLIARSAEDGSPLWTARVSGAGGDGPNCTPTVDGDLVYAMGRAGDLLCAKADSGELVWSKNFGRDFGGKMMSGWGYSESPLVDGDRLICTPGGDQALLAALDKRTGEPIWTTQVPGRLGPKGRDGAGYSSVVISNAGGVKQYVTLVGRGVVGVDAATGKLLWGYNKVANGTANVPTPLVQGDLVFCSSGYGDGGSALLEISKQGRGLAAKELYYLPANKTQNHHGGMLLIGDHVYMGHGHNNGFPLCMDLKSGSDVWRPGRGPGSRSAAVCYADGHLYFRYENKVMALIEATPEAYRLKSSFKLPGGGPSWPHPVIADGRLYIRAQDELFCYDLRAN